MTIVKATAPEQIAQVRQLFEEYRTSFGFTPCFQNFGEELASLPGKYAGPSGRLGIATDGERAAGCVALRPLSPGVCEFKRLYVRPEFRGSGLGRRLLVWVIAEAKAIGYGQMVCDTMPVMADALAMYERSGFVRTAPYGSDPTPGAIYLRLDLDSR